MYCFRDNKPREHASKEGFDIAHTERPLILLEGTHREHHPNAHKNHWHIVREKDNCRIEYA
jgi:hypothetical protein